jgi:nucleoside-diphosphate-sugar epimerase
MSLDIAAPQRPVPRVIYNLHDVREPIHTTVDGHFDLVFNLAAVHRTPGHAAAEYYDTNIAGAVNCVAYCERNSIDTLFFTSSISVYGPSEEALDEESPPCPVTAYGHSKRLAEEIHCAWLARDRPRRLRIVRPAVVFGEGEDGNYTRLAKLLQRGSFLYPGRKDTMKSGGYVKELVHSMIFALQRPEPVYLYNFTDRHCPTIEEICTVFHEEGGARRPLGVVPLPVVRAAATVCEALNAVGLKNPISKARVDKLVHSTHILPNRLIKDGYQYNYDLSTSIRDWIAGDVTLRPLRARPVEVARPQSTPMLKPVEKQRARVKAG